MTWRGYGAEARFSWHGLWQRGRWGQPVENLCARIHLSLSLWWIKGGGGWGGDEGEGSNHPPFPPRISGGIVPSREKGTVTAHRKRFLLSAFVCTMWGCELCLSSHPLGYTTKTDSSPIIRFSELSSKGAGPRSARIWLGILLVPERIGLWYPKADFRSFFEGYAPS